MKVSRLLPALAAAVLSFVVLAPPANAESLAGQPANVERFMDAYRAWGRNARNVDAYMNLFVQDGTARLWDSGLETPRDWAGIRSQIEGVLKLAPDYVFVPETVTSDPDGRVVFIEALNTGTVKGKPVSFKTMHRLVLGDPAAGKDPSRVQDGRRFWDQVTMFRPVEDPANPLRNLFEGITASATDPAPAIPLSPRIRQLAWNREAAGILVAGVDGTATLLGPGLTEPISGRRAMTAYLDRLFGAVRDVALEPRATVSADGTEYREWVGTAVALGGSDPRPISFSLVERTVKTATGTAWSLHFDTLDLIASVQTVKELRARIFG
ncbi:nuclear transport factor 2 family protein [Amycolatopsis sp. SB7-3]|uniref:nuclear transport factor 2 family protein n=1 Tax=Amycolatopsis sp. SB7-3 TaxID=3373438 RepID=UPI00374298B1